MRHNKIFKDPPLNYQKGQNGLQPFSFFIKMVKKQLCKTTLASKFTGTASACAGTLLNNKERMWIFDAYSIS
jgi:hypothetical protein